MMLQCGGCEVIISDAGVCLCVNAWESLERAPNRMPDLGRTDFVSRLICTVYDLASEVQVRNTSRFSKG
jgi:hypothetical protein